MLGAARGRPSAASPARILPSSSLSLSLLFLFPFLFFHFLFSFFSFLFFHFSFSFLFSLPPLYPSSLPSPSRLPAPSRSLPALPRAPPSLATRARATAPAARARAHVHARTRRAETAAPPAVAPLRAPPSQSTHADRVPGAPPCRSPLPRPCARAARRPHQRHLSLSCSPPRRARARVAAPLAGRPVPLAATPTPAHVRTPHSAALCSPLPLTSRHPCTTSLPVRRSTTRERGRAPLRLAAPPAGQHLLATAALDHPTAFPPL